MRKFYEINTKRWRKFDQFWNFWQWFLLRNPFLVWILEETPFKEKLRKISKEIKGKLKKKKEKFQKFKLKLIKLLIFLI